MELKNLQGYIKTYVVFIEDSEDERGELRRIAVWEKLMDTGNIVKLYLNLDCPFI
jgi:hypothetical protein